MGGTVLFAFIFFYYSAQNETGVGMVSISLELFLDRRRISRRSPASFVLAYLNGSYHAWCPRCRALYGHAIPSACTSKEAVRTNAQPPWPPDCFPQVHKQESNRTKKNGKERLFGSTLSMAVVRWVVRRVVRRATAAVTFNVRGTCSGRREWRRILATPCKGSGRRVQCMLVTSRRRDGGGVEVGAAAV